MGERAQESHQGPGADPSSGQCPFLLPAQALPGLAVSLPSTSAAAPRETQRRPLLLASSTLHAQIIASHSFEMGSEHPVPLNHFHQEAVV